MIPSLTRRSKDDNRMKRWPFSNPFSSCHFVELQLLSSVMKCHMHQESFFAKHGTNMPHVRCLNTLIRPHWMPIITNMASSYVKAHKNVRTAESPKPTLWCSGKGDKWMEMEKKRRKWVKKRREAGQGKSEWKVRERGNYTLSCGLGRLRSMLVPVFFRRLW